MEYRATITIEGLPGEDAGEQLLEAALEVMPETGPVVSYNTAEAEHGLTVSFEAGSLSAASERVLQLGDQVVERLGVETAAMAGFELVVEEREAVPAF